MNKPVDEVGAKLKRAGELGLGKTETINMLQRGRVERMIALIEMLHYSASQHPELREVLNLLGGNPTEIEIRNIIERFHDYPIVQQLLEGVETGFQKSAESSVVFPVIENYRTAIDAMHDQA